MTFLLILIICGLVWLVLKLRNRVHVVEEQLAAARAEMPTQSQWNEILRRVWRLENPPVVEAASALNPVAPEAEPDAVKAEVHADPTPEAAPTPIEFLYSPAVEPSPLESEPVPPSLAERLRRMLGDQEWEMLVGGNLLNKLGALILVIGIALFVGYSFGHITAAGRALMAIGCSVALLGAGIRTERSGQYRTFARGLIGAGWAALYATAYAIYAVPEARLIENPLVGSIGLVLVAIGMIWHSLRYKSQAITAVAYFAAFAAMAVTPSSPFAVVSLIPLAASLLYLAWRFQWLPMALFGLVTTWLTCISRGRSDASLAATQSLFLAYWLLFEAFDLLRTKRRLLGNGLDLLSPVNSACFLALSYLSWSSHAPEYLWLASAFAGALFLGGAILRFNIRPPATFGFDSPLLDRLRAGSYEGNFLVASILAGLAIVGKVPGLWSGVGLAAEAEIVYLAGLRLESSFLRRLGARAFALSLLQSLTRPDAYEKTMLLGIHSTWNWTPPVLFHAVLFYVNRALRRPNVIMSSCAALLAAGVLGAEVPTAFVGVAWILFGLALFEVGQRKSLFEFRAQSWLALSAGIAVTAMPNLSEVQREWLPLASGLALFYGCALRTKWLRTLDTAELRWTAIAASAGAALLGAMLAWRLAPPEYTALAWCAVAIIALELGSNRLPAELRLSFTPLGFLAACGVLALDSNAFAKFPPAAVSLTYAGATLAALLAALRLTLRPPAESAAWERTILRDTMAALACACSLATVWLVVPDPYVTVLWTLIAVIIHEAGSAVRLVSFRAVSLAALCAIYIRVLSFDLDGGVMPAVPVAIAGIYAIWYRTLQHPLDGEWPWLGRLHFWLAILPVLAFIEHQAGDHPAPAWWSLLAIGLVFAGIRGGFRDARLQSYLVAALAFIWAAFRDLDPPRLWISGLTVTGFYAAQILARRSPEAQASTYFSMLGTVLLSAVLYFQASGGLLTVSWGLQGFLLLALGFALRERILRLQGLGLLLLCILKLFFFDLRNLETIYRILSFVVLGLILLSVSWIYSRFRKQMRRLF